MKVAAVVPHWNRSDLLRTLLDNLGRQTRAFDEIIVVDNGSTDDSAEVAAGSNASVRFIRLERNLGFAAAVNRGIREADVDYVAILNNDVTLDAEWLQTMLDAIGEAAFAAGKILSAADPRMLDGSFDEISRAACSYRCGSGKPDGPEWAEPRKIRMAPMTAALFRRDLFDEIGYLDEDFVSYLEDADFGVRCALAGRDGVYVPAAVAFHQGSATLGAWQSNTVQMLARNQILLAAKHFGGQPRWPIVAAQMLWGLLALRHGTGRAYLTGKLDGFRAAKKYPQSAAQPLARILEASERQIFDVQQKAGFDLYWRAYFWLLGR